MSQTFPEGKGVETHRYAPSSPSLHRSRRPSQKVKVLKLNDWESAGQPMYKSQTFPEGKGVETLDESGVRSAASKSQTFPEGKGVETSVRMPALQAGNLRGVADLPRR